MSTVIFPLFSTLIFPQLFCQLFRKAEPETRIILKLLIFNKNIIKSHKDLYTRCSVSVRAILAKDEVGFFFFFFFFVTLMIFVRYRCVKGVRIRNFSGSYFPTFGLYTERHFVRVEFECGEVRSRKSPNTALFTHCK